MNTAVTCVALALGGSAAWSLFLIAYRLIHVVIILGQIRDKITKE